MKVRCISVYQPLSQCLAPKLPVNTNTDGWMKCLPHLQLYVALDNPYR